MHLAHAISSPGVGFEALWAQALSGFSVREHLPHGSPGLSSSQSPEPDLNLGHGMWHALSTILGGFGTWSGCGSHTRPSALP
jgi:hypothetical protein